MSAVTLMQGDCCEKLNGIPAHSVNLVLADPPYGITHQAWDTVLPFEDFIEKDGKRLSLTEFLLSCYKAGISYADAMSEWTQNKQQGIWKQLDRILTENGAVILFSAGAYTKTLMDGKTIPWRYNLIWQKTSPVERGSFYCGRMISAQKETVFRNSDYNKLQKVYSIWLCIAPDEKVRGVCNTYSMSETCLAKEHHFPKKQYDNFCIIIACLQDKQSANNMVRFFSSVFDNDMPVEEKLDLARECGLQVTADVKEGINQMCNYSDYVEQKGIEKGRIETLSESVVKLVRSGTLTLDAALDVLQVSDDIRATVKENAEKALNQ